MILFIVLFYLHVYQHTECKKHAYYELTPIKIGCAVTGIDLTSSALTPNLIHQIKQDLYKYKILVFKKQMNMTAERQMEVCRMFGDELDDYFRFHPKSPHRVVYRVSTSQVST